jgi:DNA-binding NarL/FixJ family response regulator
MRQGHFEVAERLLEGNELHPRARRARAAIALARGDLALAEDLVHLCLEGQDPSDPAGVPLLELLVEVRLARGDVDAAREARDRLVQLAAACGDERSRASAQLATGRVAAADQQASAVADLQEAGARFAALDLPYEAARAQLELARALAAQAPAAAVAEARIALRTFERLGAERDADAAGELLRARGAAGRAWPRRHGTLTKREAEVLTLLPAGLSNAEIGERLHISRRTAEHHVARILSKLGLSTRAEAAVYAVRESPQDP